MSRTNAIEKKDFPGLCLAYCIWVIGPAFADLNITRAYFWICPLLNPEILLSNADYSRRVSLNFTVFRQKLRFFGCKKADTAGFVFFRPHGARKTTEGLLNDGTSGNICRTVKNCEFDCAGSLF
jgi:hypothetical protein